MHVENPPESQKTRMCVPFHHLTVWLSPVRPQVDCTWEASYTRSWDTVQEDEAGSLQSVVDDWMARGRRRRFVSISTSYSLKTDQHSLLDS